MKISVHSFIISAAAFLIAACAVIPGSSRAFGQDGTVELNCELTDDSVAQEVPDGLWAGSFTVSARFNVLAEGSKPGNGDHLGMIWCVGSGWNDGLRLYYSWPESRYVFQIGRAQGAVTCRSERASFPGAPRQVDATFDAETGAMKIYVDGEKTGEAVYEGSPVIKDAKLIVGYNNHGVGSNQMTVETVAYWSRALSPVEIAARNDERPEEERALNRAVASAGDLPRNAASLSVPDAALDLLGDERIPEELRARIERSAFAIALEDQNMKEPDPVADLENFTTVSNAALESAAKAIEKGRARASEDYDPTSAELSAYGEEADRLQKLSDAAQALVKAAQKIRSTGTRVGVRPREAHATSRELAEQYSAVWRSAQKALEDLKEACPKEATVFAQIARLETSADQTRRLERDALAVFTTLSNAPLTEKFARNIYVAPTGSDETGQGTQTAPYASLARAFDAIAANPAPVGKKAVVQLAPGVYQVDRTAKLSGAARIIVQGTPGETVLTGARQIANFQSLTDVAESNPAAKETAERFGEDVRDQICVADLAQAGVVDFGSLANRGYGIGDAVRPIPSLYVNGVAQTLARWPNEGDDPLKFGDEASSKDAPERSSTFKYDFDRPDGWRLPGNPAEDDVWAFGLYQWEWAANLRRVLAINRDAKTITFDYDNGSGRFTYYFVNVPEELDVPGEYYVDRASGLLYMIPPTGIADASGLNAAFVEFDEFAGRFVELEDTEDFILRGVAIRGGRETAVTMKECRRCYVDQCAIEEMGGHAVVITGGSFCGVLNSRLRSLGSCGVRIVGGDRDSLTPCRHILTNSYISDFSRIDRVYAPALLARGCGIVATNNLICDSPHHAMRTDGNDIYIARNEIHSVVYEYSDQAGIDVYCDPSFRGIVIERNLWRHIGSSFALCGQAGIRLDDSISGVVMKENVFYRSSGGMFGGIQIHGGKDNLVQGNVFADCKQALSFSPWGGDRYEKFVKERFPQHVESEEYRDRYPFFSNIFEHYDRNYILDNRAVNCGKFNSNGDSQNVYAGNVSFTASPNLPEEAFLTNRKALRTWLESVAGFSLKDVGLKSNWEDEGEDVSPHFIGAK